MPQHHPQKKLLEFGICGVEPGGSLCIRSCFFLEVPSCCPQLCCCSQLLFVCHQGALGLVLSGVSHHDA